MQVNEGQDREDSHSDHSLPSNHFHHRGAQRKPKHARISGFDDMAVGS